MARRFTIDQTFLEREKLALVPAGKAVAKEKELGKFMSRKELGGHRRP